MFPIVETRFLGPEIKHFRVLAPRIARKRRAGQFVIVRLHEHGERIPLTVAAPDPDAGTITLVVQGIGKTTPLLNALEQGGSIVDVVGPLDEPSRSERFGTVVVVGWGVGTVIQTMGAGRAAAKTIHEFLSTGNWQRDKLAAGQTGLRTNWKKER